MSENKRRVLVIGDAGVSTGFERGTRAMVEGLAKNFEVHILGINYHGDPPPKDWVQYPATLWPCRNERGGDVFGVERTAEIVARTGASLIVLQQDPWNVHQYVSQVKDVPVVGVVAVDGLNCRGNELNGLAGAIFWTRFGELQAKQGGYTGPSAVVPLGVDTDVYKPYDSKFVRDKFNVFGMLDDRGMPHQSFVVGVVGRNQPRKRLDLSLRYFAKWIHKYKVDDALLWLHVAPTGETAVDLDQLARYYRITERVVVPKVPIPFGVPQEKMAQIYNCFDLYMNNGQGEGFGLPCIEAMASGIPCLVGDWAALGSDGWTENAVARVPCTSTAATLGGVNAIGGVMDEEQTVLALQRLYINPLQRLDLSDAGRRLVAKDDFRWSAISAAFGDAVDDMYYGGAR
jgi:D-inositol-3-phosphate glycosyltransferase